MPLAFISFCAWSIVVSATGMAAPETLMRNARSFARTAASGMIHPAWLTPSSPICPLSISLRVFKYSTAATTSAARSSNDAVFQSPVEPPTPRLS
jgi:hypothetical protein